MKQGKLLVNRCPPIIEHGNETSTIEHVYFMLLLRPPLIEDFPLPRLINCLLRKFEIIRGQDGSKRVFQAALEKVTAKEHSTALKTNDSSEACH